MYENVFADEEEDSILPEEKSYRASLKKRLVLSVIFTALAVAFSFFSIIDANIENTLMPMHIPVLLGGFACGGPLGFLIGFVSPLIRFIFFSSGGTFSETLCCCFELAVCGCLSGYLFRTFPQKLPFYSLNVAISLISCKAAFFILKYLLTIFFSGTNVAPEVFISQRLTQTLFGIVFQIVIVPIVVFVFKKAKIAFNS